MTSLPDLCWPQAEWEGGLKGKRREMRSGREETEGGDRTEAERAKHICQMKEKHGERENRLVD